jgi:hypothetical protein
MLTYFLLFFVLLKILMTKQLELLIPMIITYSLVSLLGAKQELAILLTIIGVSLRSNILTINLEGFSNKKAKKKNGKNGMKKTKKEGMKNKGAIDLEKELQNNLRLDTGTTFLKAYESLDPSTIKNMQKDTVALIETQKTLMNTLSNMGPLLKNSEKLMKVFKSSFGK